MGLSACALPHDGYLTSPEPQHSLFTNHCPNVKHCERALNDGPHSRSLGSRSRGPRAPPGRWSASPQRHGLRLEQGPAAARRERAGDPTRSGAPLPALSGLLRGPAPPGPGIQGPCGRGAPRAQASARRGGTRPVGGRRVGEKPSGPSRPPYLTGAASPGRYHGAAGPVGLLRRRHLAAPGPRPRRQHRPVPAGASAIARDFSLCPAHRPPYRAGAPPPRPPGEPLPLPAGPAAVPPPPRSPFVVTWWA